ncbi:hypothetical protein MITS9509_01091 [Synechococcus sp. MIT S9509]|nr:hypothetical protein MITS9504_00656 [Synechococcus sp. MIT S9504]KZR92642.1 hypothetical protein MITS9509_01091 [Synechococcus sp. MIT S9509]
MSTRGILYLIKNNSDVYSFYMTTATSARYSSPAIASECVSKREGILDIEQGPPSHKTLLKIEGEELVEYTKNDGREVMRKVLGRKKNINNFTQ